VTTEITIETAVDLYRRGFTPIPIRPKSKATAVKWDPWTEKLSEKSVRDYFNKHPDHELAVLLSDKLLVLDADTPEAVVALHQLLESFEVTPTLSVNTARGCHVYLRRAGDTYAKSDAPDSKSNPAAIDIKTGRAIVAYPPSTGKNIDIYEIETVDDLPEVDQPFIDEVYVHNGRPVPRPADYATKRQAIAPHFAKLDLVRTRISQLLDYIHPDINYQDWLRCGIAIFVEMEGSELGFQLFDEWSAKGTKYPGPSDLKQKWETFDCYKGRRVTIATIAMLARNGGANLAALAHANTIREVSASDAHDGDQKSATEAREKANENVSPSKNLPVSPENFADIEQSQPLNPSRFPSIRVTASGNEVVLATIPNIRHLMDAYGISARYDVIKKKIDLRVPGLVGSPDNADNSALSHVISLSVLNGIPHTLVPAYIAAIADTNLYNPAAEFISSRPWDGRDRLEAFYETLTIKEHFPEDLKRTLIRRWMISAVAAVFHPNGFRARGVLVLQGDQSIGKTSFFLSLIPDPVLRDRLIKTELHLDASNKDSITTAISHWVVEIGELDSSFKKDVALLKGFLTGTVDKVRRPYDRKDSHYPRRTVFCASVNSESFLVDDTGNTRWWTIPVTAVDYEHGIDMQQLWAQVLGLYEAGEQWWLTGEEEALLEQYNKGHRIVNAVRDRLESVLDESIPLEDWELKTATEVLKDAGFEYPTNPQTRDCGTYLREHFGAPTRSKGKTRWNVPVKKHGLAGF
jgi:putative DNA primase/helicase